MGENIELQIIQDLLQSLTNKENTCENVLERDVLLVRHKYTPFMFLVDGVLSDLSILDGKDILRTLACFKHYVNNENEYENNLIDDYLKFIRNFGSVVDVIDLRVVDLLIDVLNTKQTVNDINNIIYKACEATLYRCSIRFDSEIKGTDSEVADIVEKVNKCLTNNNFTDPRYVNLFLSRLVDRLGILGTGILLVYMKKALNKYTR